MSSQSGELEKWGYPLAELYRLALIFYKQNAGKAIHLSYEDNLKLIAFKQQAVAGPFKAYDAPELGVLDVIGKDRRLHWQMLGDISQAQAMEGYIDLLDTMCTAFRPYVEAVKQNRDDKLKADLLRMEQEKLDREIRDRQQQEILAEGYKEEMRRRKLQDSLNKQTYHQFKSYAEKQFPGNPEQQAVLIRQLQQEHYHQYMQQDQYHKYMNQLHSQKKPENNNGDEGDDDCVDVAVAGTESIEQHNTDTMTHDEELNGNQDQQQQTEVVADDDDFVLIQPAKIWTRPDICDFKTEVGAGDGDGVITIGHGDTVTVRVPTHANGKSIFWEFATDHYDIGFGIYFEWSKPVTSEVTVHVSDSDEDEDFNDEDYLSTTDDLEYGSLATEADALTQNLANKPPISIIVPIYRRECFKEVYVGSHIYPGEGVYLLKFDNSFSIWRSKKLYYRVYYER